jgi:hypothetical protein
MKSDNLLSLSGNLTENVWTPFSLRQEENPNFDPKFNQS